MIWSLKNHMIRHMIKSSNACAVFITYFLKMCHVTVQPCDSVTRLLLYDELTWSYFVRDQKRKTTYKTITSGVSHTHRSWVASWRQVLKAFLLRSFISSGVRMCAQATRKGANLCATTVWGETGRVGGNYYASLLLLLKKKNYEQLSASALPSATTRNQLPQKSTKRGNGA